MVKDRHEDTLHSCQSCNRPDAAESNMVECSKCKLWEHFGCAGVDEGIKRADRRYYCKSCSTILGASSKQPNKQLALPDDRPSSNTRASSKRSQPDQAVSVTSSVRAAMLEAQLKIAEEELRRRERELLEQAEMKKKELEESERQLEEKKKLAEEERTLRERKLKEEKELKAMQSQLWKESMEKRQEMIRLAAEGSNRSGSIADSVKKVSDWLDEHTGAGGLEGNPVGDNDNINKDVIPHPNKVPDNPVHQVDGRNPSISGNPPRRPAVLPAQPLKHSTPLHTGKPPIRVTQENTNQSPIPFNPVDQSPSQPAGDNQASGSNPVVLTQQHIAARQVLGKELPVFSGNPEDWPIFISSFQQSTIACGYSDAENLIRLQRCLRGRALETVKSRLLLPSGVPHVIQTLRTLYGRPELLIHSLIDKIHHVSAPRHDRLDTLIDFGISVQNLVDHLVAAEQKDHLSNPVLMRELVEKLPGSMRLDWVAYKSRFQTANLETFGSFMSGLVNAASEVTFDLPGYSGSSRVDKRKPERKERGTINAHASGSSDPLPAGNSTPISNQPAKPCMSCGREGHRVAGCPQFKSANVEERWKLVQQKGLCRTCLNSHGKWPCRSWRACEVEGCRQKHHTLLHSSSPPGNVIVSASHMSLGEFSWPLFRMLPVVLFGNHGPLVVFAFIDEGSSFTLLEDSVADQLGVSGPTEALTLQWTGNVKRIEPKSKVVQVDVSGRTSATKYKLGHARTVSSLLLPSQTLRYRELAQRFPHLRGLPVEEYELVQPKLLIGLDNLHLCVPLKLREGGPNDPIAAKCRLGWSVYGSLPSHERSEAVVNFHVAPLPDSDQDLNEQMRDYFAVENTGVAAPCNKLESEEDQRAIRILRETTRRIEDGCRFETALLWKEDNPNFPDSYPMAVRRLESLERKLQRNPQLAERVSNQVADYERKGYAHKATLAELTSVDANRVWYLPLGVVTSPKKPDKIRLIWDAAAKVGEISFNSKLLKGPDLLIPLPKVLCLFRQFPIAVSGDLMEMFHQLKMRFPDCQSQRFVFRNKPTDYPQVYIMDVATFGSTCSPASAQYVKNQNAQEFADKYPRAADAIINKHYVDDYLDSFRTVQEAIEVVNEVKKVHSMGGFTLRRFLSNEVDVLRGIGEVAEDESKHLLLERAGNVESVLGMKWLPGDDVFTYSFVMRDDLQPILKDDHIPTKREVVKVVMTLFDPLGLISFFLVHGKILIQDIWARGTSWDDTIPNDLYERWRTWTNLFPTLDLLRIPRCYFRAAVPKNIDGLEIHVFCDASEAAFSCAAYFRAEINGEIQVAFIGSKTKVAPLKTLSIPRLELNAAVIGTRLLETLQNHHSLPIARRFLWSDSSTVLSWIRSDHRRYHKFVAFRIGEILTTTDPTEWRWVPTKQNVADQATKWNSGPQLSMENPWFRGPSFLFEPEDAWPVQRPVAPTKEELRSNTILLCHLTPRVDISVEIARFNSWSKLQRTVAFVFRYVDNNRRKKKKESLQLGVLTQDELKRAEELLWKIAQKAAFPEELSILVDTQGPPDKRHRIVPKSSPIYKTWPFMDDRGILRMRGRIGAAPYSPTEAKFPAILPRNHPITYLVIDWYHRRFRHANRETVVNEIRQKFEIPKLRSLVEKVMKNCVWCRVAKAAPRPPAMAPLPEIRLTPFVRPFTFVGIDYFGPVFVRVGRSLAKRWIALFTCLTIRAVHMEVVHSLSTESCIMAVRRFISRRGPPREFYTDNGTCFQGASRELRKEIDQRNEDLALTFTSAETSWKFIPPAAPHMGGAWERLVRSVKVATGAVLDAARRPDDETLETVILEAEAMINCRPLTFVPIESADQEALTPNHFLLGSSSGVKILPTAPVDSRSVLRSNWKLAQFICDEFWRRWVKEYLPVITRRCKWFDEVRDLEVGDLVMVVGESARNKWLRGRVEQVFPGKDGRVRQALVRTATGVLRRPAVKLAVLDVADCSKPGPTASRDSEDHQGLRVGVCGDGPPVAAAPRVRNADRNHRTPLHDGDDCARQGLSSM